MFYRFFYSDISHPSKTKFQSGFVRTNCMDCLDRTNVVQSMIAKEALKQQLQYLRIIDLSTHSLDDLKDFSQIFKNCEFIEGNEQGLGDYLVFVTLLSKFKKCFFIDEISIFWVKIIIITCSVSFQCDFLVWADNGDECSKQYAGTGALKADFTRVGKRTLNGAINDGVNAITRYFKNNFADGYRQDAIDLFLGNVQIDATNLPIKLEDSVFNFNTNGGAIAGAIFSAAMMLLCVLISENITATIFWFIVFFAFMVFIFLNGEEFVSKPKLKID